MSLPVPAEVASWPVYLSAMARRIGIASGTLSCNHSRCNSEVLRELR